MLSVCAVPRLNNLEARPFISFQAVDDIEFCSKHHIIKHATITSVLSCLFYNLSAYSTFSNPLFIHKYIMLIIPTFSHIYYPCIKHVKIANCNFSWGMFTSLCRTYETQETLSQLHIFHSQHLFPPL